MNLVAITQRVLEEAKQNERRDALDQRWINLLSAANLCPLILPNNLEQVQTLINSIPIKGIILTGGNDLFDYAGNAPERDQLETWLLKYAEETRMPILGVCRGMQCILHNEGVKLTKVDNHVRVSQTITINGSREQVNSYHNWAAYEAPHAYQIFAIADDAVIKGIKSLDKRVTGIMWHPERIMPFRYEDIDLLKEMFVT